MDTRWGVHVLIVLLRRPCTVEDIVRAGSSDERGKALSPFMSRVHNAPMSEMRLDPLA